ncbi:hypothetical protein I6A60_10465 [Frankia sp. AgB1.9]|uniref:hypothetical protein n=1 Tax=unclassified Frankia TaxID=2632575 RepID=UPI0019325082|nr:MULTISPECIES: hypothetical protein [unclassified Frankia]MBL7488070.1 hypothetical protein [Frankia sp. AgW1.1]MBL7548297.1 hypothetical protein [Frankia sp. AgB1.9]MBL7618856.1 hypothetical protein [Frankia sp. AgB1.8]
MRAPTPIRGRRAGSRPATATRTVGVGLAAGLGLGLGLAMTTATTATAAGDRTPATRTAMPSNPAVGAPGARAATPSTPTAVEEVTLIGELGPQNGSGVSGSARAVLRGTQLAITITPSGLAPGLPHPAHLHIGGRFTCPPAGLAGRGVDGHLRTTDALPYHGPAAVALTTTGDTSPASELALNRFPVGHARYQRTLSVSQHVADDLRAGEGVLELHGVDYNHDGRYDGAARSDLDPALPEEATDPAACVRLTPVPRGGVDAGGGALGTGTTVVAAAVPKGTLGTGPGGGADARLDPSTRPADGTGATGWIGSDVGVAAFIGGLAMLGLIAAADQRRLVTERRRR